MTTFFLFFSKWTNWTPGKINFAEFAMNRQQGFILVLSHVKAANLFLAAHPITSQSSKNAKTTTDASSTKRIGQLVKLADCGNVSW